MINFDRFPNNKRKALTMSYDDGKIYDRQLVKIFDKYGIKSTFHINAGYLHRPERINKEEVKELFKNHEIAAHGYTHQSLGITPRENMISEIIKDREALETIAGYPVRGMSYPNGLYDDTVISALKACGIEYSRVMETHKDFSMPKDFYKWHATVRNTENLMEMGEKFLELPYKNRMRLMYVWGHSKEFEEDGGWQLIENFCKMMSCKDDIWYASNIEIVDYVNSLKSLKFSADCKMVKNPTAYDLWISVDEEPVKLLAGSLTYIGKN